MTISYVDTDAVGVYMSSQNNFKNCSNSSLLPDRRTCYSCAKGMQNETDFATYIQELLDYCVLGDTILTSKVLTTSAASQTSASATQTSTTQASTSRITGSTQPSKYASGGHSDISTIVPAVVIPVSVVGLTAALFLVFITRRQRKRSASYPTSPPPMEYKAQLHADDLRPELGGSTASGRESEVVHKMPAGPGTNHHKVELPAGEVAKEMEASRENK